MKTEHQVVSCTQDVLFKRNLYSLKWVHCLDVSPVFTFFSASSLCRLESWRPRQATEGEGARQDAHQNPQDHHEEDTLR